MVNHPLFVGRIIRDDSVRAFSYYMFDLIGANQGVSSLVDPCAGLGHLRNYFGYNLMSFRCFWK